MLLRRHCRYKLLSTIRIYYCVISLPWFAPPAYGVDGFHMSANVRLLYSNILNVEKCVIP